MTDIELPEPLKVKSSIARYLDDLEEKGQTIFPFLGTTFVEEFAQLYLLNKYKSRCFAKASDNIHLLKTNRMFGITIPLKINYSKDDEIQLKNQFEQMSTILANCVKRGENTIIIPLSYTRGTGGHANMLILRINRRELEHFEPHGGEFVGNEKLQNSSKRILTFFVNILNREFRKDNLPEVTYVDASQVCPYIQGLQDLEGTSKLPKRSKLEPGGYCAAWSIFFAELCLKNPDIPSSELLDNIYNYLTTKSSGQDYLRSVIRGYAGYITQQINTYLSIFFKPNVTVGKLLANMNTTSRSSIFIIEDALKVLIELETYIAMNPDFDLRKELKKAMKEYRDLTKGKTKEEQIQMRRGRNSIKRVENAYYKKRILQNYEEYKRIGRVSEPVFDSPQEISREKIQNLDVLKKGLLHEKVAEEKRQREEEMMKKDWYVQQKVAKEVAKKQKASRKISPTTDKTKTKKNVLPKQLKAAVGNKAKLLEDIIRKENIDMTTNDGKLKLLKILQELGQK
jgi:hypothetical protein